MHRKKVAVLRGGPGSEHEVSIKTGATILNHISRDIYNPQDIFISPEGLWHKNGIIVTPHEVIYHSDIVWNALHGQYGEDGKVQHILELHGTPFTGSGSFASALGMNKVLAKEVFVKEKIKTPQYKVIAGDEEFSQEKLISLFRAFPLPFIVKPVSAGSSAGVTIVKDFASFEPAIAQALKHSSTALIEEYISGIEATAGVIDGYRDQELYALPPIEIRPKDGKKFFDYEAKYAGMSEEIVPGNFTVEIKTELENIAKKVHQVMGLRHYSRTDFIVSPRRGIFVLEVNTLPGMTEESLLPKAIYAVGGTLSHFIDHVLQLALERK